MERHLSNLEANEPDFLFGKISGAVGTYSNIDPRVEIITCHKLGILPAKISTQIVSRDCHENVNLTGGVIFSEDIMLALTDKGMSRDVARSLVQELAHRAWDGKLKFSNVK